MKPCHRPKFRQTAALNSRRFSATPQRPFLDECLVQTHTLLNGIHDTTGLPWAATIPLVAVLVRMVILQPLYTYSNRIYWKRCALYPHLAEATIATEKAIRHKHGDKSALERKRIHDGAMDLVWRQWLKRNRAQSWRSYLALVKVPIWFTMMETIRRMTGTEEGMLSLAAKSLIALKGQQNPGAGTVDESVPMEPSLATEGMLWFPDLTMPDPLLILPLALSAIVFATISSRNDTFGLLAMPGSSPETARKARAWNLRKHTTLKIGALALAPATLLFPSAMLLYWISAGLAAIVAASLPRIRSFRATRSPGKKGERGADDAPAEAEPKVRGYRCPTMKELRSPTTRKKEK